MTENTFSFTDHNLDVLRRVYRLGLLELLKQHKAVESLTMRCSLAAANLLRGDIDPIDALWVYDQLIKEKTNEAEESTRDLGERMEPETVENWDFLAVDTVEEDWGSTEDGQPYIGQPLIWTGEKCALTPGYLYTVEHVTELDSNFFVFVNNGYYRYVDFAPVQIKFNDLVRYTGEDETLRKDLLYKVVDVQNWAGHRYLVIISQDIPLSIRAKEFQLVVTSSGEMEPA